MRARLGLDQVVESCSEELASGLHEVLTWRSLILLKCSIAWCHGSRLGDFFGARMSALCQSAVKILLKCLIRCLVSGYGVEIAPGLEEVRGVEGHDE